MQWRCRILKVHHGWLARIICGRRCVTLVILLGLLVAWALWEKGSASSEARRVDTLVIRGTPEFCAQVARAIELLKTRAADAYAIVTNNVGVIKQGKHSRMLARKVPPVFELSSRSALPSVTWCAGVVAHDSMHSKLFHEHKALHGLPVPKTAWADQRAEMLCIEHQVRVLEQVGGSEAEMQYCRSLNGQYVEIPDWRRNW